MPPPPASFKNRIYNSILIVLFTGWTLTALGFSTLDMLNRRRQPIEPIASISLLTFLACRLLLLLNPRQYGNRYYRSRAPFQSLAYRVTNGYHESPQDALIMLILSLTWLYEIATKAVVMFFMTVFGGVVASAIYSDGFQRVEDMINEPFGDLSVSDLEQTSLAEIDEFQDMTSFNPVNLFKAIPPKALIFCAALVWVNLAILTIYVLRTCWRATKMVFGTTGTGRKKIVNGVISR